MKKQEKSFNSFLLMALGLLMIFCGYSIKDKFIETEAVYDYSKSYKSSNPNDYFPIRYEWYYKYRANGISYHIKSNNHTSPSNGNTPNLKVLYNPQIPKIVFF